MKKRVQPYILEDMKKYVPGVSLKEYEICYGETDPDVINFLRSYYDEHLPVDVTAWVRVNKPNENLIFADGLEKQLCFVRDELCKLLYSTDKEQDKNPPMVISTHYSKSVRLPVYQINLKKYGVEIVFRHNFYDWKVSVKSDKPLEFDTMGIFSLTEEMPAVYCEGFPKDKVYGSYDNNHSQFTIELRDYYELYTFIFLLKNYLGITNKR